MSARLTTRTRLVPSVSILFLLALLIGVTGLLGLRDANHAYEQTFTNQLPPALTLSESDLSLTRARTVPGRAMLYPDDKSVMQLLDRTEKLIIHSDEAWRKYLLLPRDDEEERLAKNVATKRDAASVSLCDIIKTLCAGDHATVGKIMKRGVSKAFRDANDSNPAPNKRQLALSRTNYDESRDAYVRFHLIMIATIVLILVVTF